MDAHNVDRAAFDGELWADDLFGDEDDPDPLRIVICDDHLLFRRGFLTALEAQPDVEVVAEVDSGAEALSACRDLGPDVVLVALGLAETGGAPVVHAIGQAVPTAGVVVLTVDDDEPTALVTAVRSGASGLLDKVDAVEGAIDAVREVGRGHPALSHAAWRVLERSLAGQPVPGVTEAEGGELRSVTTGGAHGPSSIPSRNRLRSLLRRLRAHPPPEVVAAATAHGLVPG